jgi:hypothetical protein
MKKMSQVKFLVSYQFTNSDITWLQTQMRKLLDKVSEVYHGGVSTSDTAVSTVVPMETQDLPTALAMLDTATSATAATVPTNSDNNAFILKSM